MIRSSVLALAAVATLGAPLSALSECFGPVGRTDTLWLVAIKLRPDPSISPQRMMLALLKENPEAFSGDNVNALNAGSVLCFEETDSIELDDRAAVEEVRRHNRDWQTGQVAGSGDVAAAEIGPESRAGSEVTRAEPPVSASEAEPEGASGAGQRPSESLDLGQAAATFESRLARMEDRIEKLGSAQASSHATQVSELTPKVLGLETALQGALQRLDRSEREVERLRALASNSGIEDALASLESRLSALDTALDQIRSAAPAISTEFGAVSQVVSRLEEDLALLGLRAAHNEEQIRAVVTLLEAESEAIEEFKSRLRRSLRLMSSVSPPGGEIRGFEPPRAPSKDLPAVPESRSVPTAHGTTGPTLRSGRRRSRNGADADTGTRRRRGRDGADADTGTRRRRGRNGADADAGTRRRRGRDGADADTGTRRRRGRDGADADTGTRRRRGRDGADADTGTRRRRGRNGADADTGTRRRRSRDGADADTGTRRRRGRNGADADTGTRRRRGRNGADADTGTRRRRSRNGADADTSPRRCRGRDGADAETSAGKR